MRFGMLLSSIFFTAFFLYAQTPPVREIRMVAAVSPAFKQNPEWQKDIAGRVDFVNQIFAKDFQIHFSVERTVDWTPQDEARETDLLMEELRSLKIGRAHV